MKGSGRGGFCFDLAVGDSFDHTSGLEAADAHLNPADGSIGKTDFHALKVWKKTSAGNPGNFLSDPPRFFSQTTAGNGTADNGFFIADGTVTHRGAIIFRR